MRAVDHHFVLQLGIAARNHGRHVARIQIADLRGHAAADPHAQVDGSEIGLLGRRQQLVHGLAGQRQQLLAGLARHPARESQRLLVGRQLHVGRLAAPGAAHHVPAVSGGGRGVDDDDALAPRRSPSSYL